MMTTQQTHVSGKFWVGFAWAMCFSIPMWVGIIKLIRLIW